MMVTFNPRDSRSAPIDAEAMPLPKDETTPPVTNTNLDKLTSASIVDEEERQTKSEQGRLSVHGYLR